MGYADGVPLYGLLGSNGTEPSDLDNCNGHASDLSFYHYHATRHYPYLIGCLRGRMLSANNVADTTWKTLLYAMEDSCTAGYDVYDYSGLMASWTYPTSSTTPSPSPSADAADSIHAQAITLVAVFVFVTAS